MTKRKYRARCLLRCLSVIVGVGVWAATSTAGAGLVDEGSRDALQVVCAPGKPLIHPGEALTLRVWVTNASGKAIDEPVQVTWKASKGTVRGGEVATWRFAKTKDASSTDVEATATAMVRHKTRGSSRCDVWVYLAPLDETVQRYARSNRHNGRAFLLSVNSEPQGYGLFSYLLLETPPRDEQERERYIKAIESYLLILDPIAEMEQYRSRRQLNITMVPIKRNVDLPPDLSDPAKARKAAQKVLAAYDYPRAKILLADIGVQAVRGGPYLVSRLPATADKEAAPMFFDLGHVTPKLVWDWVKAFCTLAAQERSWSEVTITKLALNIRNVVAVSAREVGDLEEYIRILKPL